MQYSEFDGLKLSKLGMGCMRLPGTKGFSFGHINRSKASEIINYAMEHGINYYDTAHIYGLGDSERFLGSALKGYPRDSYYLATKYNIMGGGPMKRQFEHQLRRLKTDHIDFYLVHGVMDSNVGLYINGGVPDFFAEQKRKGNIRYLGFSSHASPKVLERFADLRDWDFGQLQLNYYDWIFGDAEELYRILTDRSIPIVVMEPVRGGKLANLGPRADALLRRYEPERSTASWAFRFLMRLPNVAVTLSGMSSMDQVRDNIETFEEFSPLTDQQVNVLLSACKSLKIKMAVPCTACRYCTDVCPRKIDIPQFMSVYNTLEAEGRASAMHELSGVRSKGQAYECIACRACERRCPQGIHIADILPEVAKLR